MTAAVTSEFDTPVGVLDRLTAARNTEESAAREVLAATLDWVILHPAEGLVPECVEWVESDLPLGGQGAPAITEYAIHEFATALGMSREAARSYLSDAVELRYRLPLLHARIRAGALPVWKARRIAQQTWVLCPDAAAWVDRHLAPHAHKLGPAAIQRAIDHAKAAFQPETVEDARLDAAARRHVTLGLDGVTDDGVVHLSGLMDLADGLDLEHALAHGANVLASLGSSESLDERRATALGQLARDQLAFDLNPEDPKPAAKSKVKPRQLVIYTHLAADAISGTATSFGLGEVENTRSLISVEQIVQWCHSADTTGMQVIVRPVIDLNTDPAVQTYQVPDRIKEHVTLRDRTCRFPWCTRPARRCDTDHINPWDDSDTGGPTSASNLASLCRGHHRAKTFAGWTYLQLTPGRFEWTSPKGRRFLVDPTGTTALDFSAVDADDRGEP